MIFILNTECDRWGIQRKEPKFKPHYMQGPAGEMVSSGMLVNAKGQLLKRTQHGWTPAKKS